MKSARGRAAAEPGSCDRDRVAAGRQAGRADPVVVQDAEARAGAGRRGGRGAPQHQRRRAPRPARARGCDDALRPRVGRDPRSGQATSAVGGTHGGRRGDPVELGQVLLARLPRARAATLAGDLLGLRRAGDHRGRPPAAPRGRRSRRRSCSIPRCLGEGLAAPRPRRTAPRCRLLAPGQPACPRAPPRRAGTCRSAARWRAGSRAGSRRRAARRPAPPRPRSRARAGCTRSAG